MPKTIRQFGVLSLGKVAGIVYACLGLVVGCIVAMISVAGGFAGMLHDSGPAAGILGLFLGAGAVFVMPVFYGVMGAIVWMILGLIYNVAARLVGGIEIEIE